MRRLVARVMEDPRVYAIWQAPFAQQKLAPLERHIGDRRVKRILDVGCGPGTNAERFRDAEYVGVDINDRYLTTARARYRGQFVQADLASAELSDLGTFDTILVNSLLHHLSDSEVTSLLTRVTHLLDADGRVHVLELVQPDRLSVPSLMAYLDRGRYARRIDHWRTLLNASFEPLVVEPYTFGGGLWAMIYFQGRART